MKTCSKCEKRQQEENFHRSPNTRDGLTAACKKCRRLYSREYYRRFPAPYKARAVERAHAQRRLAIGVLGGKCVSCGMSDERVLQFDHINGGGSKEMRGRRSHRATMTKEIISGARSDIQLLCANCNWIKRWEKHEYNLSGK